MSSAVAVVGLSFRGTDIQDMDGIFLEIYRGLTEPVDPRGNDLIVPSRAGQIVRNRVGNRLPIGLRGMIRGIATSESTDRADFATNRAAFRALFDTTLDPGALIATLEDGTTQTIDARTVSVLTNIVVPTYHEVDIELESVDPDWTVAGS